MCSHESSTRRIEMLSDNNLHLHQQNEFVGESNLMHGLHFIEIVEEDDAVEEENQEYGDSWSLSEPDKNPFESLLGNDGLSPVSNTRPQRADLSACTREFICNDSLHFCTESLGFESSDERDDSFADFPEEMENSMEGKVVEVPDDAAEKGGYAPGHGHMGAKKGATFPPPLPWLKLSVLLKPLRKDGRFLLREVEEEETASPRHELMHAWRQDGRLRLHLIPPLPHKDQHFTDTSVDSDTSSDGGQLNGPDAEPLLTPSLPSVDGSSVGSPREIWGPTEEHECVEFSRADVSLPVFLVSLDRCQEKPACLPTWNPRCITT